jgi:hypothetical protein
MALEAPVTYGREMQILLDLPPGDGQIKLDERFPPPGAESAQAAEAVFSEEMTSEQDAVVTTIGLWASTLILHDLAVEHLKRPTTEEEEPLPRRQKDTDREDS